MTSTSYGMSKYIDNECNIYNIGSLYNFTYICDEMVSD